MSSNSNRLIGLTQERAIEENTGVTDLHIGWQDEYSAQRQQDPAGHTHQAPVVTWKRDGVTYQYVPTLPFRVNVTETPWLRRVLGLQEEPSYLVDGERLIADIEQQLLSRGLRQRDQAGHAHA
ncbi:MAG: hypothetical protein SVX28_02295 [Pseudomonadota bacterium]|nr:hypothetical protein [Pseudomonadota bacterium]